jgi:PPOX class probable F420-dependent enzyme
MSAAPMSPAEIIEFLVATPARTAKLATTRADGRPHVAPVWFDLDGDSVVFATGADTVKGRNLRRDGRVAICVDDERPPFTFVTIQGTATVDAAAPDLLEWSTRIGGRYMGADQAAAYGERNAVPGELLVRVGMDHVVAVRDLAS